MTLIDPRIVKAIERAIYEDAEAVDPVERREVVAAVTGVVEALITERDAARAEVARLRAEAWDRGYSAGVRAVESGYVAGTERHIAASPNPYRAASTDEAKD